MKVGEHTLAVILTLLILPGVSYAQVTPMTPDQARQALLPYVQAPDTTLGTNAVSDSGCPDWRSDHLAYMFYGDSRGGFGGQYWIDTVNGSKSVDYGFISTWDHDPSDKPAFLSAAQLTQIASDFAAQHFSGYPLCTITNDNEGLPPDTSGASFFVVFQASAPSGALLPIICKIWVEDDVGHIDDYAEQNIPVTISTTPSLTPDQAIASGQQWLLTNFSSNPADGQLISQDDYDEPLVSLRVTVDDAENEELVYRIAFVAAVMDVDAQTGAVVNEDDWMGMPANPLPQRVLSPVERAKAHRDAERKAFKREQFWQIGMGSKAGASDVNRLAIHTHGQTYLWTGYLKALGITAANRHGRFNLTRGARTVKLTIKKRATGGRGCAWERTKLLYVPVPAVQELCPGVVVNAAYGTVTLNAPGFGPAATAGAVLSPPSKSAR